MAPPGSAGVKLGAKFTDGEKLLCYHGPLLYEAKCMKSRLIPEKEKDKLKDLPVSAGPVLQYLVHYQGWNKNWDEWVLESRILKINPDNLALKERLLSTHVNSLRDTRKSDKSGTKSKKGGGGGGPSGPGAVTPTTGGGGTDSASTSRASTPVSDRSASVATTSSASKPVKRVQADDEKSTSSDDLVTIPAPGTPSAPVATTTPSSTTSSSKRKKPKLSTSSSYEGASGRTDWHGESDGEEGEPIKLRVVIPDGLKFVLVSDWDLVVHKKNIFILPAKQSVASILQEYKATSSVVASRKVSASVVGEVVEGVADFFDAFCGKILLYGIERPQFNDHIMQTVNKKPSEVYGSAHLLRLMVKIGGLLSKFKLGGEASESSRSAVETTLADLLGHLETHSAKLFTSKNYMEATDDYRKRTD